MDRHRELKESARGVLKSYLEEERARSGIANLKLKYNRIIGYFLEVTRSNAGLVPEHFIRRQTLVGGERYSTARLGDLESEINNASERIVELERERFLEVRRAVQGEVGLLLDLAELFSDLDVLQAFAFAATVHGYVRPEVTEQRGILIQDGRHPVVEATLAGGAFVPNSLHLERDGNSFILLTGPNMAGKSTYLRQCALIVLMAQVGSFVPAAAARIGVVDHIFCRVGATDNLARGESTFLVEMTETAHILRSATADSLVIMDEVGRGTGTNDGLAIAWAVSEHMLEKVRAFTLFATHYHQLTALRHPALANFSMAVLEREGRIVFLKQVRPGPTDNSYGIHAAELAGVPQEVIRRAGGLLGSLGGRAVESKEAPADQPDAPPTAAFAPRSGSARQAELFDPLDGIRGEILGRDVARTTPLEALTLLARWQKELRGKKAAEPAGSAQQLQHVLPLQPLQARAGAADAFLQLLQRPGRRLADLLAGQFRGHPGHGFPDRADPALQQGDVPARGDAKQSGAVALQHGLALVAGAENELQRLRLIGRPAEQMVPEALQAPQDGLGPRHVALGHQHALAQLAQAFLRGDGRGLAGGDFADRRGGLKLFQLKAPGRDDGVGRGLSAVDLHTGIIVRSARFCQIRKPRELHSPAARR